jgi:predicted metalloprotease with PDZ domain
MAIFCLDVELRRRSKGEYGMDDVMAILYHEFKLESSNPGITHADIKRTLVNLPGGRRLGVMLDSLVSSRQAPDTTAAMKSLGLNMVPEKKKDGAWLGINLSNSNGCVKVRTHLTGSPCRELIHTGDEIVAIEGLRVKSSKEISAAIYGNIGVSTKMMIAREGVLMEVNITPVADPSHLVKVEGKGNKIWEEIKRSRR